MTRPSTRRSQTSESGASAVEFALVMPILILIISGIIGFGFVFAQQIALGNAARTAARAGVVNGALCGSTGSPGSGIMGGAQTDASTIGLNPTTVGVTVKRFDISGAFVYPCSTAGTKPCAGSAVGDNLNVSLAYTSTLNLPFFRPSFNLKADGTFRCEFQS